MAGGDEWIYVLSQHEEAVEDAEAEQAVIADVATAFFVVKEDNKPSKNPDGDGEEEEELNAAADDDKKASVQQQPPYSDTKAAPSSESESKDGGAQWHSDDDQDTEYPPDWYTPEEAEIEKAYDAYMAALDRALACKVDDELVETETDRAYRAYVAALDRRAAAKIDGRLIDSRLIDEALRTYRAACERAAKILDGGAGASSNSNSGGGRCPRAVVQKEKPCYEPYNDGDTYYHGYCGGSAPASLGSSYDYSCYNRYGLGFPGAAYGGPATGSGNGYEYYDGCYGYGFPGAYGYGGYAEPYASYYPPYVPAGYETTAVYLAPPPALNATTSFYPLPPPMPSVYMALAPPPAPVSIRRPAEVAPTPTTQPPAPAELSCSWD